MSTIKRNGALPSEHREDSVSDIRKKFSETSLPNSPPPLPDSLPPAETPPPVLPTSSHPSHRLDMLLGRKYLLTRNVLSIQKKENLN